MLTYRLSFFCLYLANLWRGAPTRYGAFNKYFERLGGRLLDTWRFLESGLLIGYLRYTGYVFGSSESQAQSISFPRFPRIRYFLPAKLLLLTL